MQDLLTWVDAQPVALGSQWVNGLEERKQEEAHFHDSDRAGHRDEQGSSTPNRRFYEAAGVVDDYMQRRLATCVPGRTVLDFACGNAVMSVRAAQAGARLVVGIDISETSVRNAAQNAARSGVSGTTRFLQRDCENTGLPDQSFDLIVCSGMLHHLDLQRAFPELHRVLVPGGRVLCLEALAYNPVIQLYRNRTPHLRTEWERQHILGMREVKLARRWFEVENLRFFLMAAPLATFLPQGPLRRAGLKIGHVVDAVTTRIPLLRLWSWMFSFELVRPNVRG